METVTPIAKVKQHAQFARGVARVIRLWCASNLGTGIAWSMNFLLFDSQGTATERQMLLAQYQCVSQYFVEGAIYEFSQLNVEQCHTIAPLPNSSLEIPFYYFEFVRFEDIGTSIIGKITIMLIALVFACLTGACAGGGRYKSGIARWNLVYQQLSLEPLLCAQD